MDNDHKIIFLELKRLAAECRMHSKSSRPQLALMRIANSLDSLFLSLDNSSITATNPLTAREREVLFHVSQGFTNREIASAFNISEKTIEFHLKAVFQKTDASTRTESVKNAIKNKWLE
jgi:DNA-binding NarL/FixJ family response regulator